MFLRTLITVTAAAGVHRRRVVGVPDGLRFSRHRQQPHDPVCGHSSPPQLLLLPKPRFEPKAGVYTNRLADAMNDIRRKHHLVPLKVRPCLDGFALRWARHLARTGKFEHQSLTPILRDCALSRVGEIFAKGNVTPALHDPDVAELPRAPRPTARPALPQGRSLGPTWRRRRMGRLHRLRPRLNPQHGPQARRDLRSARGRPPRSVGSLSRPGSRTCAGTR